MFFEGTRYLMRLTHNSLQVIHSNWFQLVCFSHFRCHVRPNSLALGPFYVCACARFCVCVSKLNSVLYV
jgi:hypothetical protein